MYIFGLQIILMHKISNEDVSMEKVVKTIILLKCGQLINHDICIRV